MVKIKDSLITLVPMVDKIRINFLNSLNEVVYFISSR